MTNEDIRNWLIRLADQAQYSNEYAENLDDEIIQEIRSITTSLNQRDNTMDDTVKGQEEGLVDALPLHLISEYYDEQVVALIVSRYPKACLVPIGGKTLLPIHHAIKSHAY